MWEGEYYGLSDWRVQIAYEGKKGFGTDIREAKIRSLII